MLPPDFEIRDFRDLTADSLSKADRLKDMLRVLRAAVPEEQRHLDTQIVVCQELAESLCQNLNRQFDEGV